MSYDITTSSTKSIYPVTLSEAKAQLGLVFSQDYDDMFIRRLIKAANTECENIIQKDIAYTTNVASIWNFSGNLVRIDKGNYNSITSIIDDNSTNLSTDSTTLRIWPEYFQIELNSSSTSDPLTVTYITGYNKDACPEIIKQAVLIKVGAYYDMERNQYTAGGYKDNQVAERLLSYYKSIASLN